jgi:hypothetical protein
VRADEALGVDCEDPITARPQHGEHCDVEGADQRAWGAERSDR